MSDRQPTVNALIVDVNGNAAGLNGQAGTALGATSGSVANLDAVATLPAVAGKTNYVTGFTITGGGATGASLVVATLVGALGGTLSYIVAVPAGATLGIVPLVMTFATPHPASAVNTAIVLTLPALGAGNTNAAVTLRGFVL